MGTLHILSLIAVTLAGGYAVLKVISWIFGSSRTAHPKRKVRLDDSRYMKDDPFA